MIQQVHLAQAKEPDPVLVLKEIGLGLVCPEIVQKVLKAIGSGGAGCEGVVVCGVGPACPEIILKWSKCALMVKHARQLNERDLNNKNDVFESASDSSVNESEEDNNQANDRYKIREGYHAVPPPYTGNFMPSRPDLSFVGLDDSVFKSTISKTVTSVHETETSASKTSKERKSMFKNEGKATGQIEVRPVWNNAQRVNHQNFSNNLTHPHPIRNFVPTAVITNLGNVPVNTAKQSSPRAAASTSTARYDNPQYTLQDQRIFDIRCSRHMTGNKSFLTDYQEIDGGFVTFRGSPKGVTVGNQTNDDAGIEINVNAGKARQEKAYDHEFILKLAYLMMYMMIEKWVQRPFKKREVGAEADINNLELSIVVSPIPTTRVHKDHPKEQIIGDLNLATQTRRMINFSEENAMMDVKSAFLYGIMEEEVYVCQPSGFEYLHFPNKVYKVEKALYGLHKALRAWYETLSTYLLENGFRRGTIDMPLFIKKDRDDILLVHVSIGELTFFLGLQVKQKDDEIFISQDKYVDEILKKFNFITVKTAITPMDPNKALIKDVEEKDVDVYLFRSMIRSLMYLTASRPDIMFAVCACARFQVTPKTSHLHVVKRIFICLKGQPKLGLWYPKDLPFDLEAFSDSNYAGASLDRKSTTRRCQFLGKRLISWQCKKQTIVTNSTTKPEYVVAASCCRQVLWIQNQMLDYGLNFMNTKIYIDNKITICIVKNLVFHSKTKHIEIRHHFIRDSYEKKLIQVIKIHTDHNVVDLLIKAFDQRLVLNGCLDWFATAAKNKIQVSAVGLTYYWQFWTSAKVKTINEDVRLQALVDGKKVIVNEASIRRDLRLDDAEGTACLPNAVVFEELARIGKHKSIRKKRKETEERIAETDADEDLILINETAQDQERMNYQDMFRVNDLDGDEVVVDVSAREKEEQSGKLLKRIVKQKEEANIAMISEWDNTQAIMDGDYELAANFMKKRGELSIEENSKLFVELMNKKKKHFEMLRCEERRSKPSTKAQKRKQMCIYLKNMAGFTHNQLKIMDRAVESSKRPREELESNKSKKQTLDKNVQTKVADDDTTKLKRCIEIVHKDDDDVKIKATPLSSKSPTTVDYKIYKEGNKSYFKIIRADANSQNYLTFGTMFKNFNREDLEVLRNIVKERFKKTKPVDDMDNLLFQTLKTKFEHHVEDSIWKYQQGAVKVYNWKLFDSCGVYCVTTQNMMYYLLVEKMYLFTKNILHQLWRDVRLQVDYEMEMAYDLLRLIKRQINEGYIPV
nr:hypothetical protein [Tanacetum cinerariifolium]